jgi:predicted dehydrogenase
MGPMNQAPDSTDLNRREFLKGSSLAAFMAMMGGVPLIAQPAPETPIGEQTRTKVKVGVIGLNLRGREVLDELVRLQSGTNILVQPEIVAVCDHYPATLRRGGAKVPGAAAAADYQAVLENKEIQAVVIATPTHQHKDIAIAALKAGKHVYCEAPLAHTVEDARAIALAAKQSVGQVFQAGLQLRSDPQRLFLFPFLRSGALGKPVMARAQWHKKQSWRAPSPNADREKALNWRLNRATSPGLVGELGIHALDQCAWLFNLDPVAVSGFGSTALWKDDRDVPDTVQAVIEFAGGVRLSFDATLANSFDAEYEVLYGSDAAVMMRDNKGWMFKEVDSALLGWEVYARKDNFYKETGIALIAGGSKQTALGDKATDVAPFPFPSLYYALETFLSNCAEITNAVADFKATFDPNDRAGLAENLKTLKLKPAANCQDGFAATVLALKANEAVNEQKRIELKKEWFELA